jgi:hypothetical protein
VHPLCTNVHQRAIMLFTKLLYFAHLAADRRHYYSLVRMPYVYVQPHDLFERYVFHRGRYPATIAIRTDCGQMDVQIFSPDDAATLNQIFGRLDYGCPRHGCAVVDLGSNIGLSALYFLSRCPHAVVYCFEPPPMNIERLRDNIAPLPGRAVVRQQAVGVLPGRAKLWYEDTGRYGTLVGGSGPRSRSLSPGSMMFSLKYWLAMATSPSSNWTLRG